MKKLQKRQLKAIKGGDIYCRTACLNGYKRCLSQGNVAELCEEKFESCITCRCRDIRPLC